MRALLRSLLTRAGHVVVDAANGQIAIGELRKQIFDVVVTDLAMPAADGFEVLARSRALQPQTPVIVLTADGSIRDCVKAMGAGAFNFLSKPFSSEGSLFRRSSAAAAEARRSGKASERRPAVRAPADGRPQVALIGASPALKGLIDVIERIASTSATVLITGESGTGKEVVARLLHGSSGRTSGPFIAINCGAIPESLLESELFGHAKGAFTGATEASTGKFLQADGGTLFLDEIGDLPMSMQVKLLRVLQEREVTPVGDSRARPIDVRIIAASNLDLETMVREGRFRQDLFFRLEVLPVRLPALRERREDVPLLAAHFLDDANRRLQKTVTLGEDALMILSLYAWPGNVREMENLFERLVIMDRTGTISAGDLPERMRGDGLCAEAATHAASQLAHGSIDLATTLAALEGSLIEQALRQAGGNKTHAAESLGLSRTTFIDKRKRR